MSSAIDLATLAAIPGTWWRHSKGSTELLMKFDESAPPWFDNGPKAQTITPVAGSVALTSTASGKYGRAMLASGTNDSYLQLDPEVVNFGTRPFTVEYWGWRDETLRNGPCLGHYQSTGNKRGWMMDWGLSAAPRLLTSVDGVAIVTKTSAGLTNGVWHHFAFCRDASGEYRFFTDGIKRGTTGSFGPSTPIFFDPATPFFIGRANNTITSGSRMDELRILVGKALYTDDAGFTPPGELAI